MVGAMSKAVFILAHPVARQRALDAVRNAADGMSVTIAEPRRSLEENALLHAMLGYISEHQTWAGSKHDIETWKRLLVAAWCRATNQHVSYLPALDGHGVDIVFRRTSSLSRKECAELIEYIYAWGAMNDIQVIEQQERIAA